VGKSVPLAAVHARKGVGRDLSMDVCWCWVGGWVGVLAKT
jgi:hypothetical protein